jgi:hypothetical protein
MKFILAVAASLAVGALWILERTEKTGLEREAGALRQHGGEIEALQRERDLLHQLRPRVDELGNLQRSAAEHAQIRRELAASETAAHRIPPAQLAPGQWLSPAAWKNRGQATPAATVETALWAAAGGDVASLKSLLQLDDVVQTRAGEVLAQLPESARALYPSSEQLIAAFTTKAIPLGDAQLVWQHQSGPDDAVVCVFVKNTEPGAVVPSPANSGPPEKIPPMAAPSNQTKLAYLSLRRIDDRWQVVVPLSAVEKIAKELGRPVSR